jgi:DNA (cytosine-5)-methyltransferase 1
MANVVKALSQERRFALGTFTSVGVSWPHESEVPFMDDGLPTELDGITVPKWRNESIRAAGNAIVPNVAYQIFKVIQAMAE